MADILRGLAGRFILSLNDRPEVRETFAGFHFEQVSASHTINAKAARHVAELLISNGLLLSFHLRVAPARSRE